MDALITGNRVAASLAAPDTQSCLQDLERLAPRIGMAEIRLDLMRTLDIERLVTRVARMFRKSRRTQAWVSRPGAHGRCQGSRMSAARGRARRSWA